MRDGKQKKKIRGVVQKVQYQKKELQRERTGKRKKGNYQRPHKHFPKLKDPSFYIGRGSHRVPNMVCESHAPQGPSLGNCRTFGMRKVPNTSEME